MSSDTRAARRRAQRAAARSAAETTASAGGRAQRRTQRRLAGLPARPKCACIRCTRERAAKGYVTARRNVHPPR